MYETMGLMSASMMSFLVLPAVALGALIPLAIYLVARWRDRNEHGDRPDQQIGIKLALNLFRIITFQLMLMAVFLFLLAIISEAPTGDFIRIAVGIGIPAAGLWFLHTQLLTRTNTAAYPAVGRMFDGWNLIVTGIPGLIGVVALFVVVLAPNLEGERGDILRALFPYVLTYGGAWVFLGYQWFQRSGLIVQSNPGAGTIPPPGQMPGSGHQGYPGSP